jgi:hypothetical protein
LVSKNNHAPKTLKGVRNAKGSKVI